MISHHRKPQKHPIARFALRQIRAKKRYKIATFRKRGTSWRVEINKRGVRQSATFCTKAQAQAWAAKTEVDFYEDVATIPIKPRTIF